MIEFGLGVLASYFAVGVYVYAIGKPLNVWLTEDKQVTFKAIVGWPATIRRVMRAGTAEATH